MTRADLIALAEEVERGDAFGWYDWLAHENALPEGVLLTAREAHHGDLNAAKRLHDAILGGCVMISGPIEGGSWMVTVEHADSQFSDNPARAWLLAVLRAKIEGVE